MCSASQVTMNDTSGEAKVGGGFQKRWKTKHTVQRNKSEMNATMLNSISILPDEHLLCAPSSLLLQTH